MKTLIQTLTIMIFLIFSGNIIIAQITIDKNDMPSAGDTVRRSLALNFENYDFEMTGEDFTWDYSDLLPLSQSVDTFISVNETPIIYRLFFLTSANLASPELGDFSFADVELKDVYSFYNNKSSGYYYAGFAATLSGIPIPFKYSDPDRIYHFPMDYGDVDSSFSGLSFEFPNVGYIKIEKKRVNTVDGWGTLITPYGTFEVLRLKSEVDEYDSIFLDSLNIGFPVTNQHTEYKWLAKNGKEPVLEVNDDFLNFFVYYVDSVRNINVGMPDNPGYEDPVVNLYPNPVHDGFALSLNLKTQGKVTIRLFDINGQNMGTLKEGNFNSGSVLLRFNMNDYITSPGKYLISIETAKGRIVKKIIYNP